MRGCYLSTDYEDKFLFCAGYHDGKITVLRLDPETGKVGEITEETSIRVLVALLSVVFVRIQLCKDDT